MITPKTPSPSRPTTSPASRRSGQQSRPTWASTAARASLTVGRFDGMQVFDRQHRQRAGRLERASSDSPHRTSRSNARRLRTGACTSWSASCQIVALPRAVVSTSSRLADLAHQLRRRRTAGRQFGLGNAVDRKPSPSRPVWPTARCLFTFRGAVLRRADAPVRPARSGEPAARRRVPRALRGLLGTLSRSSSFMAEACPVWIRVARSRRRRSEGCLRNAMRAPPILPRFA